MRREYFRQLVVLVHMIGALGLERLGLPPLEKRERRLISERLMRTRGVAEVFLTAELWIHRSDIAAVGDHRIELPVLRASRRTQADL